ncbi:MAG: hypothetical protein J6X55_14530, partial [Victivallales bacterium]|nr:hypothetical protein [Victivallales bacterium]
MQNSQENVNLKRCWFTYLSSMALITGIFTCLYASFADWHPDFWRYLYLVCGGVAFIGWLLLPQLPLWFLSKTLDAKIASKNTAIKLLLFLN